MEYATILRGIYNCSTWNIKYIQFGIQSMFNIEYIVYLCLHINHHQDCSPTMNKKRAEWKVRLQRSNLTSIKDEFVPQVLLARTWTMDELIARITDNGSALNPETLRCAAAMLMNEIEDCLIEGSAVSTPLGTFSPALNGTWSTDRTLPEERARNTASVRYQPSRKLKNALANPLLTAVNGAGFALSIFSVYDHATATENQCLTPGKAFTLRGHMLLMNGDLPQRGVYLVDIQSGLDVCHIQPEDFILNTRGRIIAQLPAHIPGGEYLIRVLSQCTTSSRPMKTAAECLTNIPLSVK